jgi:hypothetical protein
VACEKGKTYLETWDDSNSRIHTRVMNKCALQKMYTLPEILVLKPNFVS